MRCTMQFDLRKFIATGTQPYHAEFPCDLSARDFAGARIEQPVTASFTAEPDGDEVRMTLRAKALVHGECARCLDPVEREETVEAEWTAKERDLDDPDFELPLDEKGNASEEGDVYLYRFQEVNGNPTLDNIESDEEYEMVADAFDEWLDNAEFEDMEN